MAEFQKQSKQITDSSPNNQIRAGIRLTDNRPNSKSPIRQLKEKSIQNPPVQLARAKTERTKKTYAEIQREKRRKERKYAAMPGSRYSDMLKLVRSKVIISNTYLNNIENRLEDDEDVSELRAFKRSINKLRSKAISIRSKIKDKPLGRLRSADPVQKGLVNQLDRIPFEIARVLRAAKLRFPSSTGGFGAKGRAHKMNVEVDAQFPKLNSTRDNSFVNNFQINGLGLTANIHKSPAKVAKEKTGPAIVMRDYNVPLNKRLFALKVLESKLSGVNANQAKNFVNAPIAKPREDGQYANMKNTNAAGYAYIANIPGWKTQRWEWLHIRGAGLGGITKSSNLVAGTRDSNTHMIPFESNIRVLGASIPTSTKYGGMDVTWSAIGPVPKARHAFKKIRITWHLKPKKSGVKDIRGIANFSPLHTGSNISKKEVELVENALKEVRDAAV